MAQYPELVTRAATFVFESAYPDFVPSREWEAYKKVRFASRRLVSWAAIKSAWTAFCSGDAGSRGPAHVEEEPAPSFDSMSDGEIAELLAETRKAKAARGGAFFRNPLPR